MRRRSSAAQPRPLQRSAAACLRALAALLALAAFLVDSASAASVSQSVEKFQGSSTLGDSDPAQELEAQEAARLTGAPLAAAATASVGQRREGTREGSARSDRGWLGGMRRWTPRRLLEKRASVSKALVRTISLQNLATNAFNHNLCPVPCLSGWQCLWQSVRLTSCEHPGALWTHHSVSEHLEHLQHPGLCLSMCKSSNFTEGQCSVEVDPSQLAVGWRNCSDTPTQQWYQMGASQWLSRANNWCLGAGSEDCRTLGSCANSSATPGYVFSLEASACSNVDPAQSWNTSLISESTAEKPLSLLPAKPDPIVMDEFHLGQQQLALQYFAVGLPQTGSMPGFCLAAEYTTSCNPAMDGTVCAWQNVRAASCDFYDDQGTAFSQESVWVENTPGKPGLLQWAGGPQGIRHGKCWRGASCLDICDPYELDGACALPGAERNVGWRSCKPGEARQTWSVAGHSAGFGIAAPYLSPTSEAARAATRRQGVQTPAASTASAAPTSHRDAATALAWEASGPAAPAVAAPLILKSAGGGPPVKVAQVMLPTTNFFQAHDSPFVTIRNQATSAEQCITWRASCIHAAAKAMVNESSATGSSPVVVPESCTAAESTLSDGVTAFAEQPPSATVSKMPPFYNVASEPCVPEGDDISRQLLMRNYLLAAGNASLAHYGKVEVQLSVVMMGKQVVPYLLVDVLQVLPMLKEIAPLLGSVAVTVQEPHNLACADARLHGIACILNATQMAAAEADPAAVGDPRHPERQAVVWSFSFASDGNTTYTIIEQLRSAASAWKLATHHEVVANRPASVLSSVNILVTGVNLIQGPPDLSLAQVQALLIAASQRHGMSTAAIVGIVAAALLLLSCVGLATCFWYGRKRGEHDKHAALLAAGKIRKRSPEEEAEEKLLSMMSVSERLAHIHGKHEPVRSLTTMGTYDLSIQGWNTKIGDIDICKDENGRDWLLGKGSYGQVYKALRGGVQEVAVKLLLSRGEDQLLAFEKEIGILKSISYDRNIVQFYGACMMGAEPMLLVEYCEGGDLRRALNLDSSTKAGGERALGWYKAGHRIALDIARGVHFLHSLDVVHSDLKSQNVLLTRNWEIAKIADAGVARFKHKVDVQGNEGVGMGTFAFAAPETLLGVDSGVKADIYSFGVILWEIVTGGTASRGRLFDPKTPEQCPPEILSLLHDCMRVDAAERPSAKEVFVRLKGFGAESTGRGSCSSAASSGKRRSGGSEKRGLRALLAAAPGPNDSAPSASPYAHNLVAGLPRVPSGSSIGGSLNSNTKTSETRSERGSAFSSSQASRNSDIRAGVGSKKASSSPPPSLSPQSSGGVSRGGASMGRPDMLTPAAAAAIAAASARHAKASKGRRKSLDKRPAVSTSKGGQPASSPAGIPADASPYAEIFAFPRPLEPAMAEGALMELTPASTSVSGSGSGWGSGSRTSLEGDSGPAQAAPLPRPASTVFNPYTDFLSGELSQLSEGGEPAQGPVPSDPEPGAARPSAPHVAVASTSPTAAGGPPSRQFSGAAQATGSSVRAGSGGDDTLVGFVNPYAVFMQQGLNSTLSRDAISGATAARQLSAGMQPPQEPFAALVAAGAPVEAQGDAKLGALYASLATAAGTFQAALADKRCVGTALPQAAAEKLSPTPRGAAVPLKAAPVAEPNPFAAVAGTSFEAAAPHQVSGTGPRPPALPQQPPLRRPDLGRSVRANSVRRGSKASAPDGTKLRGIDIRMAAAAALSSQQVEEAAGQAALATAVAVAAPAAAVEPGAGQSPPANAPAGSLLPVRVPGVGARRMLVMSPFRNAEEPFDSPGFSGRPTTQALNPLVGAMSSPITSGPMVDIARSSSAGSSSTGSGSGRHGYSTATLAQVKEAEENADKLLDTLLTDLNCLIESEREELRDARHSF